jgi:hypothetical protein
MIIKYHFVPNKKWQLIEWFKNQKPSWNVKCWKKKKLKAVCCRLLKKLENEEKNRTQLTYNQRSRVSWDDRMNTNSIQKEFSF